MSDLEDCLIVPVRVDFSQLGGNSVVFSHEESVDHGEHSLFVDSGVTGQEAVNILALKQDHLKNKYWITIVHTWPNAALVRRLQLEREQIPHVKLIEHRQSFEESIFVQSQ